MNFVEALRNAFRQYAGFNGRARRSELWWCLLAYLLADVVARIIDKVLDTRALEVAFLFGLFMPTLAVEVRRLHDINRTGWWMMLGIVPILGLIVLIVFWCLDGTAGPNRFGADPKRRGLDTTVFDESPPPPARIA